jgi:hypothetical protein
MEWCSRTSNIILLLAARGSCLVLKHDRLATVGDYG